MSLLAFIATCHGLALQRKQSEEFVNPPQLPKEIQDVFVKRIKPKKRHELSILPEVIVNMFFKTILISLIIAIL